MNARTVPLHQLRAIIDRKRVPSGILRIDATLSEAELAEIEDRWRQRQNDGPIVWVHAGATEAITSNITLWGRMWEAIRR